MFLFSISYVPCLNKNLYYVVILQILYHVHDRYSKNYLIDGKLSVNFAKGQKEKNSGDDNIVYQIKIIEIQSI